MPIVCRGRKGEAGRERERWAERGRGGQREGREGGAGREREGSVIVREPEA